MRTLDQKSRLSFIEMLIQLQRNTPIRRKGAEKQHNQADSRKGKGRPDVLLDPTVP